MLIGFKIIKFNCSEARFKHLSKIENFKMFQKISIPIKLSYFPNLLQFPIFIKFLYIKFTSLKNELITQKRLN